ncbi:trypsin-like peptidase domain-containing protein [Saccharopolyspora sp. NPDC000359]|uniref:nSTAND1 domain-containing NTPase n=1 Tax=Saccharopolyspora sp. NPDC000359 TaxID=3154251 RepID=UPI003320133E
MTSDLTAAEPLAASLVRLVAGRSLLGTGFVLPGDRVATCAHVVDGVDGIAAQFPLLAAGSCAVEVESLDAAQDVAVLRLLDPPSGIRPAPVRLDRALVDHRFRVLGCTTANPRGVWVNGVLAGAQGENRVQMSVDPDHEQIVQGFSGAPVWDRELGGVVGMVVTRSGSNEATAHLLPISALREWVDSDHNPYRGLDPFRESDADSFHGRDEEVADLLEVLGRQRMVALSGPSGSGKSSLVRAGLIPRLRQAGTEVVELGDGDPMPTSGVLFLDQFEEEVVADREAARAKLERIIQQLAEHPLRVVLTLRSRSLDELITPNTAQQLGQAVWLLKPMRPDQLREAIEVPAARAGLAFEAGLPEAIRHDCPPGQLALLSTVLDQLWQHKQGVWLTHGAYQRLGRVTGALGKRADDVLARLGTEGLRRARRLLTELTHPDGGHGHVRRSVVLADLESELQELALEFARERLVVVHDGRVELPHQALIDHWPTLRGWLAEDADFLSWRAKLDDLRNSGAQLTGALLAEASAWLRRRRDIPESLRDYIHAAEADHRRTQRRWRTTTAVVSVLALVSAVLTGVVLANNRELDGRLRQINAGRLAQEANRATENNPSQALQLALAAWREKPGNAEAWGALFQQRLYWSGVDRVPAHPSLVDVTEMVASADGGVVALKPRGAGKDATVWWGLFGPEPSHLELPASPDTTLLLSPDGRLLVTADEQRGVQLRDLSHADQPTTLDPWLTPAQLGFSADGRFLAALDSVDGRVLVWDLDDPTAEPAQHPYRGPEVVHGFHPSPDGRSLVTVEEARSPEGDTQRFAVVRDLASGAEARRSPPTPSWQFAVLDAGTRAAVCADGALTIHDLFSGEVRGPHPTEPAVLEEATGSFESCRFTVDASGEYLVFGSAVMRWRTGTWLGVDDIPSAGPLIRGAGGSLDVISLRDGVVQLSTVPTTTRLDERRQVWNNGSARSPDGRFWVTYVHGPSGTAADERAQLVLLDPRGVVLDQVPSPRLPNALAFDATGEHVIVVDGLDLRIYRASGLVLEHEARLPAPAGFTGEVSHVWDASVATAPGGTVLISHLGVLSSWDPATGRQVAPPLPLRGPGERVDSGPQVVPRPGHEDQLLVWNDGVEVWGLRDRQPFHRFEVQGSHAPVVSQDGSVAAVAELTGTSIALFDLTTMTPLPPLNASGQDVIGISGDYLFAVGTSDLYVWQWRDRVQVASLDLGNNYQQQTVEDGTFTLDDRPAHREVLPLDPQQWFDDLCRISDREYTPQEAELLAQLGVDNTPPCR